MKTSDVRVTPLCVRLSTPFKCDFPKADYIIRRKTIVKSVDPKLNIVRNKAEFKSFDRREEMRPYKVSDFSLSNLIAVGAKLNPTQLSSSPLRAVDDMQATLANININPKNE